MNGNVSKTIEGEFNKVRNNGIANFISDSLDSKNLISSKILRKKIRTKNIPVTKIIL